MKAGNLLFFVFFINVGFTIVNMTELASGVQLQTNAAFNNPLNSYVSEAYVIANGGQDALNLFASGDWNGNQRVDIGGTMFGAELGIGADAPLWIAKPLNFILGIWDMILNIVLMIIKLFINTLIVPLTFFPSLFYDFFPTDNAKVFGVLIGLSMFLVLIWDLARLIAPGGAAEQ